MPAPLPALLLACLLAAVVAPQDRPVPSSAPVSSLAPVGVPGPLVAAAPGTRVLAWGESGGVELPLVALVPAGDGRILAFGHGGYLSGRNAQAADLIADFALEASPGRSGVGIVPGAGVGDGKVLREALAERGVTARLLDPRSDRWPEVVVAAAAILGDEPFPRRLVRHLAAGGSLVTAGLGWGWLQLHPGADLGRDHPGNRLLGRFGLGWADGTLSPPKGGRFPVGRPPAGLVAHEALEIALEAGRKQGAVDERTLRRCERALVGAVAVLPEDDRFVVRPLAERLEREGVQVPREGSPLGWRRPLERAVFLLDLRRRLAPGGPASPHPAAADFPGRPPASAPRVARRIEVDPRRPGWHSTGLYLDAGDALEIEVPRSAERLSLAVRVGVHTDRLVARPEWRRAPVVACEVPLSAGRNTVRWPFGGLVELVVRRPAADGRPVGIRLRGAVWAPFFVAGRTSAAQWRKARSAPGPWAELASDRIVVTVPSDCVRDLDDPGELMRTWDRVLDLCADLAGIAPERPRPERIVADRQLAAGYMHAGYPIFCHLDQARNLVDARRLREEGNWGFFHELGHNHQRPEWTFDGTGEVTCNLFTLYVLDELCGKGLDDTRMSREERAKLVASYDFERPDFERWKRDPFLALVSYAQIVDAFGWEPYRRVFREYRNLPPSDRPRSDDEKRDQWLVRLSRAVGRDLGPFFRAWGMPVSQEALAAVAGLPDWWCDELPAAARRRAGAEPGAGDKGDER